MIIQVVQTHHDSALVANPHGYRYLMVQRRHSIWRVEWGGWQMFGGWHKRFPEGFELLRSDLAAGKWADLKPRTIRVPFDKYLYWHEGDACGVEVVGPGFLLGCHISLAIGDYEEREEKVYLVTNREGHYFHLPNAERKQKLIPWQPAKPALETVKIRKQLPHEGESVQPDPVVAAEMCELLNEPRKSTVRNRSNKSRYRLKLT